MKYYVKFFYSLLIICSALLTCVSFGDNVSAKTSNCFFMVESGTPILGEDNCALGSINYGINDVFTGRDTAGNGQAIPWSAVRGPSPFQSCEYYEPYQLKEYFGYEYAESGEYLNEFHRPCDPRELFTDAQVMDQFISFVRNRFYGSNIQDKVGAAYTIRSMLSGSSGSSWPSSEDVSTWEQVLRKGNIVITRGYYNLGGSEGSYRTSVYNPAKQNVSFHEVNNRYREALQFWRYDSDGGWPEFLGWIETGCGNMNAGFSTIIDDEWAVSVSTEVNVGNHAIVYPDQEVIFSHAVSIIGTSDHTTWDVSYGEDSEGAGIVAERGTRKVTGTIKSGTKPYESGSSDSWSFKYKIKSTDVEKWICQDTYANPSRGMSWRPSYKGPEVKSPQICVYVSSKPKNNKPCRPIQFAIKDPHWSMRTGLSFWGGEPREIDVRYKIYTEKTHIKVYDSNDYNVQPHLNDVGTTPEMVTALCTTGNRFVVEFETDSYAYASWVPPCDEYCFSFPCFRSDSSKSTYTSCPDGTNNLYHKWEPLIIGPCFDYSLTPEIKLSTTDYQVETNSVVNLNLGINNDSWIENNDKPYYDSFKKLGDQTYGGSGLTAIDDYLAPGKTIDQPIMHTKTKNTEWQVTQLIVEPSGSEAKDKKIVPNLDTNRESTDDPCTYYKSKANISRCSIIKKGTSVFEGGQRDKVLPLLVDGKTKSDNPLTALEGGIVVGDYPAGTKICFAFSLHGESSEPSNDSSDVTASYWVHSSITGSEGGKQPSPCIIISKKPKVQVLGGDLSVGKIRNTNKSGATSVKSNIATTTSIKNVGGQSVTEGLLVVGGSLYSYEKSSDGTTGGKAVGSLSTKTFGSWDEYGLFASDTIIGMGSKSGLIGGLDYDGKKTSYVCGYSKLTFTSAGTSVCDGKTEKGSFNQLRTISNVEASFLGEKKSFGGGSVSSLASGVYNSVGNMDISASTIGKNQSIVIKSDGNINISGNLNYQDSAIYNGISEIPQLVIIADNIDINPDVTRVDAWLIARDKISTCAGYDTAKLTKNYCNQQLRVNGPIMSKRLYMRRTYGSESNAESGTPAEIFNLRADAYLWGYSQSILKGTITTVYVTEVPPRY